MRHGAEPNEAGAVRPRPAVSAGSGAEPAPGSGPASETGGALPTMEVNQAVMVTVELDFGPRLPGVAEALTQIERRHQPDAGTGRVFAILDAYGEPTPDGRKLHLSMHVSSERPGVGALVFKPTGETLWQSRIVATTNKPAFTGQGLTILLDDGRGRAFMVDGSGNPATLWEARMKETGQLVSEFWPEGAEREVTFLYSACGCPVKVQARREGLRAPRTRPLPVIFPDDPAVVTVIARLLGW